MKKQLTAFTLFVLALVAMACTGCKSTTVDFNGVKVRDTRVFLRTEADVEWRNTNGMTVIVKAKSDPQAEMLKAIAEGLAKGMKPIP